MSDTEQKIDYPITVEKNEEYSIKLSSDLNFSSPEYPHLGWFESVTTLKGHIKRENKETLKIESFEAFLICDAYETSIQDIKVTAILSSEDYGHNNYFNILNITQSKKDRVSAEKVFPKTFNNEIIVRKMEKADKIYKKILEYKKLYYSRLDKLDINKLTEI